MSHLGEQLSALVDGELNGAERDRVNAHLASCAECRVEASELRGLKRELHNLAAVPEDAAMLRRLIAMAGPGGPVPPRGMLRGGHKPRALFRTYPAAARRPGGVGRTRPSSARPGERGRRRYVVVSAVSLVVVSLGAAAFSMGGSTPGPRVKPSVEIYSVQHAITTGEVPYPGSSPATDGYELPASGQP